jgi:hypothetical protein
VIGEDLLKRDVQYGRDAKGQMYASSIMLGEIYHFVVESLLHLELESMYCLEDEGTSLASKEEIHFVSPAKAGDFDSLLHHQLDMISFAVAPPLTPATTRDIRRN